ncbi:MAG TPA: T9SS type A sorting domain-containing protein, partial [Ignavibacteriales bacterium]|nr:T9SS type A sorting domain-containing protein [Ignavibacteriales bacterium]
QNYPNPFNPETVISFHVPFTSRVRLKLFDSLGREIATLLDEEKAGGSYSIKLNSYALGLSSGVYFYRLDSGGFVKTCKMLLLK